MSSIPKVIYQTWKTKNLPESCFRIRQNIQSLNPEYEMKLFDDDDMRQFIQSYFDTFTYHCYLQLNVGAAKADFWRYCVLYIHGGVYLDIKSEITKPLNDLIQSTDSCIITREGNVGFFNNWIMIFQKNHPILLQTIRNCCYNISHKTSFDISHLTGPHGPFTKAINEIFLPLYNEPHITNLYFEKDDALNKVLNDVTCDIRGRFYGTDMEHFAKFTHDFTHELYSGHSYWRNESKIFIDINVHVLKIYEYPYKKRLGVNQDGGYVMAELDGEYDCYISAGVSDEESFTKDFIQKYDSLNEYNSFAFDGTISNYPYQYTQNISFIHKNIGTIQDDHHSNLSFLIEKYNHIFLKMDIEGYEVPWILSLTTDQLQKFKQIVIEFHGLGDHSCLGDHSYNSSLCDKWKALEKISQTHYFVHAHGNNCADLVHHNIPFIIELTCVNKKYFYIEPPLNTQSFPILGIDFPNIIGKTEIELNGYPFQGV